VQGATVLSQVFTATESGALQLSWADANRTNYGGLQSYVVSISDGVNMIDLGTYGSRFGGFVSRTSDVFTVTSGVQYTLTFTGVFSGDRTSFIDNVALTSVPEPSTWAMMLAGFGMMGFALRRRRLAAAA
jgi:hypothetical protein